MGYDANVVYPNVPARTKYISDKIFTVCKSSSNCASKHNFPHSLQIFAFEFVVEHRDIGLIHIGEND